MTSTRQKKTARKKLRGTGPGAPRRRPGVWPALKARGVWLLSLFVLVCGVLAAAVFFFADEPPEPRRHVIVVMLDAARPDRFSCYGYPRETTPEMDRLAQFIMSEKPALIIDDPFPVSAPDLAPNAPKGGRRNP